MKKLLLVVVLFLGIAVVALSFSELETILLTLKKAHIGFFILAILVEFVWLLTTGRMYKSVYRLLGLDESIMALSRIAAAANFINIVAPTAGMGGVALFASEARRRGHPAGRVTVAAALFLSLDQVAFLFVLALGLIVLVRRNDLDASEISASLFMLGMAIVYAFILYLGYRSEEKLGNLLAKIVRLVNRVVKPFLHHNYLSEDRAHEFAHEVAEGFSGLTEKPSSLFRPILWGILDKILLDPSSRNNLISFQVHQI
jgi:uncharacterized membrane protein YbhN (UPF0104 family)